MIQSSGGKKGSVKGEVSVNLLLLSPEGMYVQSKGRVPFEEEIPLGEKNGQGADVSPAVFGRIVMLEVNGDEDGIFSWSGVGTPVPPVLQILHKPLGGH